MENAGCWNPAVKDRRQPIPPVTILNQIYEGDFKGFSYGFRPGRGPHQALDALSVGIHGKRVKWVLDAILNFFVDSGIYQW
jgi:RNA-directed DNA polymerase